MREGQARKLGCEPPTDSPVGRERHLRLCKAEGFVLGLKIEVFLETLFKAMA